MYSICIELVIGEGQFLTVVYTDILQPTAMTLIQNGLLCVGFGQDSLQNIIFIYQQCCSYQIYLIFVNSYFVYSFLCICVKNNTLVDH